MSGLGNCVRCNKPLIVVKCFICGARSRGRIKGLKTCSACGGRGINFVCPDTVDHFVEDYKRRDPRVRKIVRDVNRKFKDQKVSKPTVDKNIIDLIREKKVPPPRQNVPPYYHPMYPGRAFEQARQAAERSRQAMKRLRRKTF